MAEMVTIELGLANKVFQVHEALQGILGFLAHPANAHVFDHPLVQQRGPLVLCGNLPPEN